MANSDYQQLRSEGQAISFIERAIALRYKSRSKLGSQIAERERLGMDVTNQKLRYEAIGSQISIYEQELQAKRAEMGSRYDEARAAAPKKYFTGAGKQAYTVTTDTGKTYVSSNKAFLEQKAQQQAAMKQAQTGTANFSLASGGTAKVTYGESAIQQKINEKMEQKGFIVNRWPKKVDGERLQSKETPGFFTSPITYSSDAGYSTKSGYSLIYPQSVFVGPTTQKYREKMAREQAISEGTRKKVAYYSSNVFGVGGKGFITGATMASDKRTPGLSNFVTTSQRNAIGLTVNTDRSLYSVGETPTSRTGKFFYGVANAPNKFVQNPIGEGISYAETASGSYLGGMAYGGVVSSLATRSATGVAARSGAKAGIIAGTRATSSINLATGGTFAAYTGYQFYTNPQGLGEDAPKILLGGYGFSKGSGITTQRPITTFKQTNTVTPKSRVKNIGSPDATVTLSSRSTTPYVVEGFGLKARGKVVTDTSVMSGGIIGDTRTQTPTFKVYGISNTRTTGILKGKPTKEFYTGTLVTGNKKSLLTLEGNRGAFTSEYFGTSDKKGTGFSIDLTPQKQSLAVTRTGVYQYNTRKGVTYGVGSARSVRGANTDLFNAGFKRTPSPYESRTFYGNTYTGRSTKLRQGMGKRGEVGGVGPSSETVFRPNDFGGFRSTELQPQTRFTPEPVSTPRYSARGGTGQASRVIVPNIGSPKVNARSFSRSPAIGTFLGGSRSAMVSVTGSGGVVSYNYASKGLSTPNARYEGVTTSTPSSFSTPKAIATTYPGTSSMSIGTATTSIPGPRTPTTPPTTPGFTGIGGLPIIPGFGMGRGGSDIGSGSGRKYGYMPSFTAIAFNIKGSRPGKLTGFEVRPILSGSRKKRKGAKK